MLEIHCPSSGGSIQVKSPSGTICVSGTISGFFGKELAATIVRVRVLNGQQDASLQSSQKAGTDRDTNPSGASWCAKDVAISGWTGPSGQITVIAWEIPDGGSASAPQSVLCTGGGSGAVDCCANCPSGAMVAANELASSANLEITIPDGPNAGSHKATGVGPLAWRLSVGGIIYELCCDSRLTLAIVGPNAGAVCLSFASSPFSATFAGDIFQAKGDIVVTRS